MKMKQMPKYSRYKTGQNKLEFLPEDCQGESEGDQPCDFFGRNDAKAETPVLWPPHVKS